MSKGKEARKRKEENKGNGEKTVGKGKERRKRGEKHMERSRKLG